MKVLVLVPDLNAPGGVSSFFKSLEGQFKDHDITYITRGTRANLHPIKQFLVKFWDYFNFIFKIIGGNYDLIHVNTSLGRANIIRDPWFVLIGKIFRVKVLVFFHGWRPESITSWLKPFFKIFLKADAMVVLATQFQKDLESWGYSGTIHLLSTIVSLDMEQLLDHKVISENENEITILFLSRIEVRKGIYESLKAFNLLQQKSNRKLKLQIAGDGTELENVKKYVADEGLMDVEFCGFVSGAKKAEVLLNADIYLLPSYSEGMPISVLEAMMAGLAVVTRKTGGLNDFFDDRMGRITDSLEPMVFCELINELISDPRTLIDISDFNIKYSKSNFTVNRFVEKIGVIYLNTFNK